MSGKLDGRSYAGTLKNFQSTHIGYRAHRAVIFAIAWHLVHFAINYRQTSGSISPCNIAGLISNVSEEIATEIAKNCRRRQPTVI